MYSQQILNSLNEIVPIISKSKRRQRDCVVFCQKKYRRYQDYVDEQKEQRRQELLRQAKIDSQIRQNNNEGDEDYIYDPMIQLYGKPYITDTGVVRKGGEEVGLIPRSIVRSFKRFSRQVLGSDLYIQEYRMARAQFRTVLRVAIAFVITPLVIHLLVGSYVVKPVVAYTWNKNTDEIFLNETQQERALKDLEILDEIEYFDRLLALFPDREHHHNGHGGHHGSHSTHSKKEAESHSPTAPVAKPATFRGEQSPGTTPPQQPQPLLVQSVQKFEAKVSDPQMESKVNPQVLASSSDPFTARDVRELQTTFKERDINPAKLDRFLKTIRAYQQAGGAITVDDAPPLQYTSQDTHQPNIRPVRLSLKENPAEELGISMTDSMELDMFERLTQFNVANVEEGHSGKYVRLAEEYNEESIEALTHVITDISTIGIWVYISIRWRPQMMILKSVLIETAFGLPDSTKAFLLILGSDLFVGFHSSSGWEIFLEGVAHRFGLPEDHEFSYLFVATFPVLLDTGFKYFVFRYLNRVSPSTVATYYTMLE